MPFFPPSLAFLDSFSAADFGKWAPERRGQRAFFELLDYGLIAPVGGGRRVVFGADNAVAKVAHVDDTAQAAGETAAGAAAVGALQSTPRHRSRAV